VDGFKDLASSLKALLTPERLDGNNKYNCAVCGSKQPALKGTQLTELPSLLTFQLKRFGMNWDTMSML